MGNPYYVPRQRSPLIDYARLGLQLYGLKQEGAIAKGQQDVDKRRLVLEETKTKAEYGTPESATPGGGTGLAERRVAASESAGQLTEQKFQAQQKQIEAALKPVSKGEFAALEAALPQVNEGLGFAFDKAATPYMNNMKNLTEQGMHRLDLYNHSRKNWDQLKKPFTEAATKELEKAVKENDAGKVKQLTQTIDVMDKPDFIDQFYPNSARIMKAREEEAETKRLSATKAQPKSIGLIENEAAARARGMATVEKKATPEKPSLVERRGLATGKDLGEIELLITNDTASETEIATFNRHSKQPYLYLRTEEPGTLYGTNTVNKRIDLPKINGKQISAKDVAATAEKYGKTIEEVLADLGFK